MALFIALFYALSSIAPHKLFIHIIEGYNTLDLPQCIFFVLAILLSVYSFGLLYLHKHSDEYKISDDHLKNENQNIRDTKEAITKEDFTPSSHPELKL